VKTTKVTKKNEPSTSKPKGKAKGKGKK